MLTELSDAPTVATAFVPIWRRPWMTVNGDTYGASLLRTLGIELVTSGAAVRYPLVDLAEVAGRRPDLVIVPSEPYAFDDRHLAEIAAALPAANVVAVDGEVLFWWGIRTADAHARLGAVLAPVIDEMTPVRRDPRPR
jgi:ABC-type Fe3+-hydroxamate transport system substrate-binding protein